MTEDQFRKRDTRATSVETMEGIHFGGAIETFSIGKPKDVRGVRSLLHDAMRLSALHGVCEATMQLRLDEMLP